jgi:hypothetical protein
MEKALVPGLDFAVPFQPVAKGNDASVIAD